MDIQPQDSEVTEPLFDLTVHYREKKTGKITEVKPYRLHIIKGSKYFERPVNSGCFFFENDVQVKENEIPEELAAFIPQVQKPVVEKTVEKAKVVIPTKLSKSEE